MPFQVPSKICLPYQADPETEKKTEGIVVKPVTIKVLDILRPEIPHADPVCSFLVVVGVVGDEARTPRDLLGKEVVGKDTEK